MYDGLHGKTKEEAEHFFPELKESEDEKIRKAIITFFESEDDNTTYALVPKKDILTWLEKQGKSKWNENDEHHLRMCLECVEECAFQDREDFSKTTDWLKSLKQRMEE